MLHVFYVDLFETDSLVMSLQADAHDEEEEKCGGGDHPLRNMDEGIKGERRSIEAGFLASRALIHNFYISVRGTEYYCRLVKSRLTVAAWTSSL